MKQRLLETREVLARYELFEPYLRATIQRLRIDRELNGDAGDDSIGNRIVSAFRCATHHANTLPGATGAANSSSLGENCQAQAGSFKTNSTVNVDTLTQTLINWNLAHGAANSLAIALALIALLLLALLINFAAKQFIKLAIHPIVRKTTFEWDDLMIRNKVFMRCSHIVPALVIHLLAPLVFVDHRELLRLLEIALNTYIILIILLVIDAALNFLRAIWERGPIGKRYPAKSFSQAAKIVINLIGLIFILSVLLGKSPVVFFSGLGAVTAILLLIFKDAILGLVAGFQLSVDNMVMVGDWIEMLARGADGDVIDVSLTTVKVQNWDKTITTIPTYALISDSFKNWRGMSESGDAASSGPSTLTCARSASPTKPCCSTSRGSRCSKAICRQNNKSSAATMPD